MKKSLFIATAFLLPNVLWAKSGKTGVQLEMHSSTASYALDGNIKGAATSTATVTSSTSAAAAKGSTTTTAAAGTPDSSQVDKINQYMRELRSADSASWPRAAQAIRSLNPNLAVPPSILIRMVKIARAPADRQKTRSGWITICVAQNDALDALARFGPQAHAAISDLVKLTHRLCIHEHVVQALDQIGTPDQEQLAQISRGMNDKDPEARQAAVEYLAKTNATPEVIQTLGRAMNDSSSGVRLSALQALEEIHPEGEGRIPLLAGFLKDSSPDIRERALYMIGQLGPDAKPAVPLLHQALHDSDPLIALEGAKYLAKIDPQDEDLLKSLIAFTKNKMSGESEQAAELLQSLNIHEALIDNALEPYRKQETLRQRVNKTASGMTPEELAENNRAVKIRRVRMASRIVQNQPVNIAKSFAVSVGRVYCWTEVSVSTTPATLSYRWYRNGKLQRQDLQDITATSQSLWSSSPVHSGSWKVEIAPAGTSAAQPLATAVFTITSRN